MKKRLSSDLRNLIQEDFGDNPVYLFLRPTVLEFQQTLEDVKLFPEEVFAECFRILDRVKSHADSASDCCSGIFDDSYSDLLDLFPGARDSEIRNGATIISLSVAMCLFAIGQDELFLRLMNPVMGKDLGWTAISRSFVSRYSRHSDSLSGFLNGYMASARMLSQETGQTSRARQIDTARLKGFFKSSFRGIGNGNMIDLFPLLVHRLQTDRNAKEFAVIALMIYNSPYHINRQCTFVKWHRQFCSMVECEYKPYRPSRLIPSQSLKNEFSMLL